ncbi:MAG: EamA family transporter [Myxococcales bacterium]|nr:EamA family transporter [Myxococcales bacterium]
MTPTALALVLGASVAWSALDALRKALGQRLGTTAAVVLLNAGQLPAFLAWAWLIDAPLPAHGYWAPGLALVALNIAASLLFVQAVTVSPLSLTIPFLALTPVFATGIAATLLGEWPRPGQLVGVVGVCAGAVALNPREVDGQRVSLWRAFRRERGSAMMVAVALIWSAAVSLDKLAMRHAAVPVHAAVQAVLIGAALAAWLALRGRATELVPPRGAWGLVLGASVAISAAVGLQLIALKLALAALVEAIKRGIGLILAVAFGRLFFGERIGRRQLYAVAAMAAGAAAVMVG